MEKIKVVKVSIKEFNELSSNFKIKNCDVLKGFNLQELQINPCFAGFIDWFGDVTNDNVVTTEEILKSEEMKKLGRFIDDSVTISNELEKKIGNLMYDDDMIEDLEEEFSDLLESEEYNKDLLSKASANDLKHDTELNQVDSETQRMELDNKQLSENCKEDAKFLESLCTKNIENRHSLMNSFSGQHSDPLRWCQIDLDSYCVNCEDVALSLKIRFEEKLKMRSFVEIDNHNLRRIYDLQNIESGFAKKMLAEFDAQSDTKKVNIMMEILSKPFEPMSYTHMSERTEHLSSQNQDVQENIESLENTINEKIRYLAHQEAKFCEIESNREKYKTAEKRLQILKAVRKPISDILLVGDVLWLSLSMEKEDMKNILQKISMSRYVDENKKCAKNMQILTKILANSTDDDDVTAVFSNKVDDLIREDSNLMNSANSDVDCNESTIHRDMKLQHIISDSYQMKIIDLINNLDSVSQDINMIIGEGPLNKTEIWNLSIVADLEIYKRKYELMLESARTMRHTFMEKYHQPSVNDELWKRRQFLWIWFLTDQKTFLEVLESTVADSKKTASSSSKMFTLGGLRRQ